MSDNLEAGASSREIIKDKLRQNFDGKIVRKDLTKKIKEGANVPVYVLEFLLGQYCSSDDDKVIEQGVQNVKRILADNFVRPDEAQKVLSRLRSRGSHKEATIQSLKGAMREGDYGLFVTLSNYTKNAQKYLDSTPIIRGINGTELVDLILKYYHDLSDKYKKMIPLKMIYIPVPKED